MVHFIGFRLQQDDNNFLGKKELGVIKFSLLGFDGLTAKITILLK